MKKLLCTLTAVLLIGSASFAQTDMPKKEKTKAKKEMTKVESPDVKAPAKHMKKDGTPDMRYKENKAAAKKN